MLFRSSLRTGQTGRDLRQCINSFPSESFTENEAEAFDTYFGNQKGNRIIEILEYPKDSLREWVRKSERVQNKHWKVSLYDFGMGENNMNVVYLYTPDIVKLDRSLICGIDNDARKQESVRTYLESFHERGMQVLAEGVETREECDFLRSLGCLLYTSLVHHSDCHLVCNHSGNGCCLCISRDGDHIQTYRTYTGHCL